MPKIYIECEYTLLIKGRTSSAERSFVFKKNESEVTVDVDICYERGSAIAKVSGASISDDHIDELSKYCRFDGEKLTEECSEAIHSISKLASDYTRRILATIKYHLDHADFGESTFSVKSEKWCVPPDELRDIPSSISVAISGGSVCPLRDDSYEKVLISLESGIKPLLAMRHLHRARHEHSAHHKWIDATIAAELAIKEVLSRANPKIETLLLELPSPPLSKLYGKIMNEYLGQQSPYRNSLIKGAEVRNSLVHRHDDKSIDLQEAINYVQEVERAIFHLLTLLYPNDELLRGTYERKKL